MGQTPGLALIGCGLLAAFVAPFGCNQASSPVEKQEKRGGVEEATKQEPSARDTPQES